MLYVAFGEVLNTFVSGVSFPECVIEDAEGYIFFYCFRENKRKNKRIGGG